MRDEKEERKKQARSNKQTRQSNTAQPTCTVLMSDEKEGRSKQGQTNSKVKQHSTPKAVTFHKKNELPQVGLEPTTLYTMYMYTAMYQLMQTENHGNKAIIGFLTFQALKVFLSPRIE